MGNNQIKKMNVKQMNKKWKIYKANITGTILGVGGFFLWLPFLIALVLTAPDQVVALLAGEPVLKASALAVYSLFFGFGSLLCAKGTGLKKQIRRFQRYADYIGEQTVVPLHELAQITHKSIKYVRKDLHRMIEKNLFTDAYVDQNHLQLVFGNEKYIALVKQQPVVEIQMAKTGDDQVDQTILEGDRYLKEIQEIQSHLDNPIIGAKIKRITGLTNSIFQVVIDDPQKITEIRRFMQYYLPTTLKILHAYEKFKTQNINGENISQAITHIESMLDTIVAAFEKLLDNLFQAETLDIMTDITVLEGLLAQEGLTEQDFKLK